MNRLKQLRESKGISQAELATMLNITQQAISAYENHKRQPDIDTLKKLSKFFEVDIDYILNNNFSYNQLTPIKKKLLEDFDRLNEEQQEYILKTFEIILNKD
ncbi:helix-turn-helix domain-containing protein [Vallitalea okinawensis]|uniref:helix-turn-helix domain-containing protein n=1 Tax=Vallitalea okinawensis TaxID=2078660 RepID=UPI000CFBC285|nr:helix-turn-helix transcriptional regulator [Vallitalea okinawensis]